MVRQFDSLLSFAAERSIPADILAIWSNQWMATLFWFLFHPVTSRKLGDAERRQALAMLFKDGGEMRFRRMIRFATAPKRAAAPLIALAAKGWQWPAKFYFRRLYYPLVERRH